MKHRSNPGKPILDFRDQRLQWLAAMVCRFCYNMYAANKLIDLIHQSRFLGCCDMTAVKKFNEERALDEQSEDVKSKEQVTELPKAKGNGKGKHKSGASASWKSYTQADWKRRTLIAYTALPMED